MGNQNGDGEGPLGYFQNGETKFRLFVCWDFTKSLPQKRLEKVSRGNTQVPASDTNRARQRAELPGSARQLLHVLSTDLRKGP